MSPQQKFLVIRLSSIGDIVLTSPIVRSLKKAFPDSELHFLTKASFAPLLAYNPYIDQVHAFDGKWEKILATLHKEQFDHIFDLHKNLRSLRIKASLRRPTSSFSKANTPKWLMTRPLYRRFAKPIAHIVERYGVSLQAVGASLDEAGLDFFLPPQAEAEAQAELEAHFGKQKPAFAVVLGATHRTKRWIPTHFVQALNAMNQAVVLLGGEDIRAEADDIVSGLAVPFLDAVGKYSLFQSAALMKQCQRVITHDTGLMHIAAAFQQPIISIWGNTVPAFGMTPYKTEFHILEVAELACRPCSKIGYDACPKGHFACMNNISPAALIGLQ